MISKYSHKELTWIDLESPKEEEIIYIGEQYSIPLSIEEEMRIKNKDSKIKLNSGFISVAFDFPHILHKENKVFADKIIFIINDDFICTIHNRPLEAINEFLKNLEIDATIEEKLNIKDNGSLFFYLMKSLYVNSKEQLLENEEEIKKLENKVIRVKTRKVSELIYQKNQVLIQTEECISSHSGTLSALPQLLIQVFGDRFEKYNLAIAGEYSETVNSVKKQEKNLTNLYNIYNLILVNKNNKRLKLLTILLVASLVISITTYLYVFYNI